MARRSILWPPKLSGGRLVMTPDPDLADLEDANVELRQVIGMSLLPGENAHPFNDPAEVGTQDPTYQGATRAQQAQIRARVRNVFARPRARAPCTAGGGALSPRDGGRPRGSRRDRRVREPRDGRAAVVGACDQWLTTQISSGRASTTPEILEALLRFKAGAWPEHTETDPNDPVVQLLRLFALVGHGQAVRLDHVAREL